MAGPSWVQRFKHWWIPSLLPSLCLPSVFVLVVISLSKQVQQDHSVELLDSIHLWSSAVCSARLILKRTLRSHFLISTILVLNAHKSSLGFVFHTWWRQQCQGFGTFKDPYVRSKLFLTNVYIRLYQIIWKPPDVSTALINFSCAWLEDADLAKAVRCPQLMIPAQNDDASATEHKKNGWPLDCWYADMPLRATDVWNTRSWII